MKKINEEKLIKYLRSLILRCLTVVIIFLILAIASKSSTTYKDIITKNIYEKNFSFVEIKKLYNKYLGGLDPLNKVIDKTTPVFSEKLEYLDSSIYHDGVKLEVSDNYLVPILEEGMVIYIGNKENYGTVVIIEGVNGIDIWYGNMSTTSVKLYDYVSTGTYLGTVKDNTLYLAYQKDGTFQNYQDYLK